jgi:hypothetical protein
VVDVSGGADDDTFHAQKTKRWGDAR